MIRYCILGGGGSFGLHTAKYLLENGCERIISIGRNPPKLPCFTLGVGDGDKRYSYHALHIGSELDMVAELLDAEKPDVIINFAAQGEGATSFRHSWRYYDTNCTALVRLLDRVKGFGHFIHISTSELYGATDLPADEDARLRPTSPYAVSKAAFDLHLLCQRDLRFVILRPSNCYGDGQQLHRIIPKAVLCGLTGRKLPLHGGGKAEKSYMHSHDLARAIFRIGETTRSLQKVYNLGPSNPVTIRSIVEKVAMQLNIGFDDLCTVTEDREHQDARYWLNSTRARDDLLWRPLIGLDDGIARMIRWGRDNLEQLRHLPTEFTMRA